MGQGLRARRARGPGKAWVWAILRGVAPLQQFSVLRVAVFWVLHDLLCCLLWHVSCRVRLLRRG
jgi:hypothetical protein